jgi:hypothetical protein
MGVFDKSGDVGRRKFLTGIIGVVAGAVGVLVGLPAIGYLISPGLKNQTEDEWLALGPIADLQPGKPQGFPYSRKIKDGWTETNQTGVAYAVTHDGETSRCSLTSARTYSVESLGKTTARFSSPHVTTASSR